MNDTSTPRRWWRHLGSSIAFGLGCIAVIAGLAGIAHYADDPHMSFLKGGTLGSVSVGQGAQAWRSQMGIGAPSVGSCLNSSDLRCDTDAE